MCIGSPLYFTEGGFNFIKLNQQTWAALHDKVLEKPSHEVVQWFDRLPKGEWRHLETFVERWGAIMQFVTADIIHEGTPEWRQREGAPSMTEATIGWLLLRDTRMPWDDQPYTGELVERAQGISGFYAPGDGYCVMRQRHHVPWLT